MKRKQPIPVHTLLSSDPPEPGIDREWPTPKRICVKQLRKIGYNAEAIEEETGVPERTQRRIFYGPKSRPGSDRNGSPKILTSSMVWEVIHSIEGRYSRRISKWQELAEELRNEKGIKISWKTLKRALNAAGYHKCRACQKSWITEDNRRARLDWCQRHRQWDLWQWRMVGPGPPKPA